MHVLSNRRRTDSPLEGRGGWTNGEIEMNGRTDEWMKH